MHHLVDTVRAACSTHLKTTHEPLYSFSLLQKGPEICDRGGRRDQESCRAY